MTREGQDAQVERLRERLEEAEATIQALIKGQIDAVAGDAAPVLLREAQEALRRSEARFRALVEKSHDGIALLAADGSVLYASASTERMLGYSAREVTGQGFRDFVHSDDLTLVEERFTRVLAQPGVSLEATYRARHRDGSIRNIETSITNRLDDPAVTAIVVNFRDVTDREVAIAALRESEQQFRAVFDGALVPILVADDEGRYVDANPAACELLGRSRENILTLRVQDIVLSADDPDDKWQKFLSARELGGKLRVVLPDGTLRVVEYAATPNVQPGRHLAMLRDVTEQDWTQKRERAQLALAHVLATAEGIQPTLMRALDALASPLGASAAILRSRDAINGELAPAAAWPAANPRAARLLKLAVERLDEANPERDSRGTTLAVHVGPADSPTAILEFFFEDSPFRERELAEFSAAVSRRISEFVRRHTAEDALRQREATLAEAERIARLGAWETRKDVMSWSDEHFRIFGHEPGSLEPSLPIWLRSVHPEDSAPGYRPRCSARHRRAPPAKSTTASSVRMASSAGWFRTGVRQGPNRTALLLG